QQTLDDVACIRKVSDICLMPFARNDAWKFISPTKALECMATHRPVVSTPIRDVERFYSDIVYLAESPEEFVKQLDMALNESAAERARRQAREEKILAEHAWDAIAANMNRLMESAFQLRQERAASDIAARISKVARPVRQIVITPSSLSTPVK